MFILLISPTYAKKITNCFEKYLHTNLFYNQVKRKRPWSEQSFDMEGNQRSSNQWFKLISSEILCLTDHQVPIHLSHHLQLTLIVQRLLVFIIILMTCGSHRDGILFVPETKEKTVFHTALQQLEKNDSG